MSLLQCNQEAKGSDPVSLVRILVEHKVMIIQAKNLYRICGDEGLSEPCRRNRRHSRVSRTPTPTARRQTQRRLIELVEPQSRRNACQMYKPAFPK